MRELQLELELAPLLLLEHAESRYFKRQLTNFPWRREARGAISHCGWFGGCWKTEKTAVFISLLGRGCSCLSMREAPGDFSCCFSCYLALVVDKINVFLRFLNCGCVVAALTEFLQRWALMQCTVLWSGRAGHVFWLLIGLACNCFS